MESKLDSVKSGHLFTLEVQLNEVSNGLALEKLLQLLNRSEDVVDYKVLSRVELGKTAGPIQQQNKQVKPAAKTALTKAKSIGMNAQPNKTNLTGQIGFARSIVEQFELLKKQNRLIRLTIAKSQDVRFDLPCRILNCDKADETVTVYHVDEKKVYTFNLSEVEHISVA